MLKTFRFYRSRYRLHLLVAALLLFIIFFSKQIRDIGTSLHFFGQSQLDRQILYPPTRNGSSKKVIVLSYFRSGSSFMADLIRSPPGTFYFFEPLRFYDDKNVTLQQKIDFLRDIINCDFSRRTDYLEWMQYNQHYRDMQRNEEYWETCSDDEDSILCFQLSHVTHYCLKSSMVVAKVNRLRVRDLHNLFRDMADVDVIYLLRDPRAIIHSRIDKRVSVWCGKQEKCHNPIFFCKMVENDLADACAVQRSFPGKFFYVQYEFLACDPEATAKMLFRLLGYGNLTYETEFFLQSHTKGAFYKSHPYLSLAYSTERNSRVMSFLWERTIRYQELFVTEYHCANLIAKLGWQVVTHSLFPTVHYCRDLSDFKEVTFCPMHLHGFRIKNRKRYEWKSIAHRQYLLVVLSKDNDKKRVKRKNLYWQRITFPFIYSQ